MKTKIKFLSIAFLLIFIMTSSLSAQYQEEETKKTYNIVVPVGLDITTNTPMYISTQAFLTCTDYTQIICAMPCCNCGNLLKTYGHGFVVGAEGNCPYCGYDISLCMSEAAYNDPSED
jgi:hypothetical protein